MKPLSVYIHIPFCVQKCKYCDFLSAPSTRENMELYMDALKKEMISESVKYEEYEIETIFFGGGTPSILDEGQIEDCIDVLRTNYQISKLCEITLEMNPGTASMQKLEGWKRAGVNRLSIGLQSANDSELRLIGRIHDFDTFVKSYEQAKAAGFDNINVDLMSALPGQTISGWRETLNKVLLLKPDHISAYSLIIEEGTPLSKHIDEYPPVPSEDEDREMYRDTKRILKEHGYMRYEVSNYAKEGKECKHNVTYWTRGNYAGFGLGASSMVENIRWHNTENMDKYIKNPTESKEDMEKLSLNDCMEEFMFLGLRMMQGVSKKRFFKEFDMNMDEVYGDVLKKWEKTGHLKMEGDNVSLTDSGIDISNAIFTDFLIE